MEHSINGLLRIQLAEVIQQNVSDEVYTWLVGQSQKIYEEASGEQLNLTFVIIPRKTGHQLVTLSDAQRNRLQEVHQQYLIDDWTVDRVCRVWILLHINPVDKAAYSRKLENLFKAAEMNELVALYSAFPGFEYPEYWQQQCAEGVRSNIDGVLRAIMYHNPYPYRYLPEPAWNQLVMKAFFTDKDMHRVIGLDERANPELASILVDYANERWSAHRVVSPQLWRLVAPFIGEKNFEDIKRAFHSANPIERKAAALACFSSSYPPAKQLLEEDLDLRGQIAEKKLRWDSL